MLLHSTVTRSLMHTFLLYVIKYNDFVNVIVMAIKIVLLLLNNYTVRVPAMLMHITVKT